MPSRSSHRLRRIAWQANGAAIESKTERHGQVGLEIVTLKEELDDTSKALVDDQKFLADLDKNCATKKQEWEERSRTRAEEQLGMPTIPPAGPAPVQ